MTTSLSSPSTAGVAKRSAQQAVSSGADLVLRVLEQEGVEICFGMPGGAILPLYDAFARGTSVRHVLVRHEQGAGHMAEGYARASGRVGVVVATSGPGATNLVTPIANAAMDSNPLLCITGQVRGDLIGTDAFQECDIVAVTRPLAKGVWQVRDVRELERVLRDALALARGGRPGPVLVDLPRDVQEAPVELRMRTEAPGDWRTDAPAARRAREQSRPERALQEQLQALADAIAQARRPVLYVGGGTLIADVGEVVLRLAERVGAPIVTTLMAKGAVSEDHELCLGCVGMHGGRWANLALNRADLVIAAGARFDDRVTGRLEDFAAQATIAHLDVDRREIGKIRHADLPVLGDLGDSLPRLLDAVTAAPSGSLRLARSEWLRTVEGWRRRHPLRYDEGAATLKPQRVLQLLDERLRSAPDVIWTTGVGKHQMWAMQYLRVNRARSFVTSGGHGTMGFGLPAAIGARAARPRATVVCVDGDGSFQMTAQELATAVAEDLPVVVVILNNGNLGMVHQWQTMFYEERLSEVDLSAPTDCALVARGFGALGFTARSQAEFEQALELALAARRTAVIDVHIDPGEQLYPMIKPGAAATEMVEFPGE